jgi:hypothetical protein
VGWSIAQAFSMRSSHARNCARTSSSPWRARSAYPAPRRVRRRPARARCRPSRLAGWRARPAGARRPRCRRDDANEAAGVGDVEEPGVAHVDRLGAPTSRIG